jgi:gliding motility-associated-like protein
MQKCRYIFFFLLLVGIHGYGQQNNRWYFGRKAGLNFNASGSQPVPTVLADGQLETNEGCASICDSNGDLLFYTNGITVYNKQHQVMVNGSNLAGNLSSVQASIIVPVPGNDSIYYVFTTDALEHFFQNGYTYSIINMRRDNGNGEVISKNVPLWNSCTERMVAARHANGRDVWLITNDNNSNIFRAWLIDCSGLRVSPVVSTVGLVMNQHYVTNNGMLKVSPDGRQLCQTHFPESDVIDLVPNFCQLFDFNNATGVISNARTIGFPDSRIVACEYSNDSKLLYLTNPDTRTIDQIECTLVPTSAVIASRVTIPTISGRYYGIQSAPDGKIYLADISSYLGAINLPDVKGAGCTFNQRQVALSPGVSYLGLPAYINDLSGYNPTNGFSFTIIDSCTGRVQFNGFTTMAGTISWNWDFGDGNGSTAQNPVHTYSNPNQHYTVSLEITSLTDCGYIKRSKRIFPAGLVATVDFEFSSECDLGTVSFNNLSTLEPDSTGVRYLWTFGDGNTSDQKHPVHTYGPGTYQVRLDVLTTTACLNKSMTKTLNLEVMNVVATADQEIDAGQTVQLNVAGGGSSFTWSPPAGLTSTNIANPVAKPVMTTTYKVVVRNDAGCSDSDYVVIKVRPIPGIYMPTAFTPNNDGLNDVIRPIVSKEFSLQGFSIFNRWGERVFFTTLRDVGWDARIKGAIQDAGVFVWHILATDDRTGKKIDMKGTFVIIR